MNTKRLLIEVFIPTIILSVAYVLLGQFIKIPHLLLLCILATVTLVPIELSFILSASKKESGVYSLKSAFWGQEKLPIWQVLIISFVFFGITGLVSAWFAPLENLFFAGIRGEVLSWLPTGFDWTNVDYLKSFPKPILIFTCAYYGIFNILIGPITEELFFRGYLTSHYKKQGWATPILITILFSLYHFWLPFNNGFRILAFAPVMYVAYKKKNIYIAILFHCLCNLFSVIDFISAIW